jgi:hypothetical protein
VEGSGVQSSVHIATEATMSVYGDVLSSKYSHGPIERSPAPARTRRGAQMVVGSQRG